MQISPMFGFHWFDVVGPLMLVVVVALIVWAIIAFARRSGSLTMPG